MVEPGLRRRARRLSRRGVLQGAVALAALPSVAAAAEMLPAATRDAITELTAGAEVTAGRVHLSMPKLAENGHAVALSLEVDSPMTAADYVRAVHVIAGRNPVPTIARFYFGPASGAARLKTRVRLADSQPVVALAQMSDGRWFSGRAEVIVTLGGCLDPVL